MEYVHVLVDDSIHSSWTELLIKLEGFQNTNFEERDQYCLMTKRSSEQKQKYVSTQIQFYVWDRWMKAKKQ